MKKIFFTILMLTLPAHAMEQSDAEALEKLKALNAKAQTIIAEDMPIVFERQRLQENLLFRKKIWFFHPSEINTDEPDQSSKEILADALTLLQRLEDDGLIMENV